MTRIGFGDLAWSSELPQWTLTDGALTAEAAAGTDFWSRTHYGFTRHDGHLFATRVAGDFVLTARIATEPAHQYDQAGLMIRVSETCWMKTSIEHEPDGADRLGVVVTNAGFSDWSTQPTALASIRLRVERRGLDYLVHWSEDGDDNWVQLRMSRLLEDDGSAVEAGVYLCSPGGAGLRAHFTELSIERL